MARLGAFNFVTLNGYFKGANEDISWNNHGEEENRFAAESLGPGATLLFGRVTYQMMASYWPTPIALSNSPEVAKGMNAADKVVFSRSMKKADWNNTRLVKDNLADEIGKLKKTSKKDMCILGSGSIITQTAEHGLLDEMQIMVDPVILGSGTPVFKGLSHRLNLKLTKTKSFKSGVVVLYYQIEYN